MRSTGRRRASWGALATLCVLAAISAIAPRAATRSNAAWWSLVTPKASLPFRLGTAARPFAWSTAVGDLNADGRPDYAIADRLGRAAGGFEYSVEFSVSGVTSRSVTFDSPDSALAVSLRDVDHDHDLDVVVSTVLSPMVVRVWLNDGRGAFAETASTAMPPEWHPAAPQVADGGVDQGTDAESTPRRADEGLGAAHTYPISLARFSPETALPSSRLVEGSAMRRRSRAPPAAASLLT